MIGLHILLSYKDGLIPSFAHSLSRLGFIWGSLIDIWGAWTPCKPRPCYVLEPWCLHARCDVSVDMAYGVVWWCRQLGRRRSFQDVVQPRWRHRVWTSDAACRTTWWALNCNALHVDHFSKKPGDVTEFCSCQGSVRKLAFCREIVVRMSVKNLVRENCCYLRRRRRLRF